MERIGLRVLAVSYLRNKGSAFLRGFLKSLPFNIAALLLAAVVACLLGSAVFLRIASFPWPSHAFIRLSIALSALIGLGLLLPAMGGKPFFTRQEWMFFIQCGIPESKVSGLFTLKLIFAAVVASFIGLLLTAGVWKQLPLPTLSVSVLLFFLLPVSAAALAGGFLKSKPAIAWVETLFLILITTAAFMFPAYSAWTLPVYALLSIRECFLSGHPAFVPVWPETEDQAIGRPTGKISGLWKEFVRSSILTERSLLIFTAAAVMAFLFGLIGFSHQTEASINKVQYMRIVFWIGTLALSSLVSFRVKNRNYRLLHSQPIGFSAYFKLEMRYFAVPLLGFMMLCVPGFCFAPESLFLLPVGLLSGPFVFLLQMRFVHSRLGGGLIYAFWVAGLTILLFVHPLAPVLPAMAGILWYHSGAKSRFYSFEAGAAND